MSYILGAAHTGTTTLLNQIALNHIVTGKGLFYIGNKQLLQYIPRTRWPDVIVIDPHKKNPVPIHFLKEADPAALKAMFKDIAGYGNASTARFDRLIYNTLAAIIPIPGATLLDMNYWLLVPEYRTRHQQYLTDPFVRAFWQLQYETWSERNREERTESTLAQIDTFATDATARATLCYPDATLHLPTLLAERKIILVNQPGRSIGLALLSLLKHQTIFIDNVETYQGHTLIRALHHNTVHLTNNNHAQLPPEVGNAILNCSEEKLVLRLQGDDVERFDRLLKIKDRVRTSTGDLPSGQCYLGEELRARPAFTYFPVPGAGKAIRQHVTKHYQVARRKVTQQIEQRATEVYSWKRSS